MQDIRLELSKKYIIGKGLELGALQSPLKVVYNVRVTYVDKIDTRTALIHYPELRNGKLVNVDVLDDGENLSVFPDESQDFIIANHFLEHTQNPIKTIKNHLLRLKLGGIIYYAVPDKRKSFDVERSITSFEHTLQDYTKGPEISHYSHMKEWVTLVNHIPEDKQEEEIKKLIEMNYAIHFHVWDMKTLNEFLQQTNEFLGNYFKILEFINNDAENIVILQKIKSDHNQDNPHSKLEMPIRALLEIYDRRKDLQEVFPSVMHGDTLKLLICWAKKYGIYEEDSLIPYTSYYNKNCLKD